ncbi:hypothetical protein Hanom_Chr04g00308531 [Helianthus anomalus]
MYQNLFLILNQTTGTLIFQFPAVIISLEYIFQTNYNPLYELCFKTSVSKIL